MTLLHAPTRTAIALLIGVIASGSPARAQLFGSTSTQPTQPAAKPKVEAKAEAKTEAKAPAAQAAAPATPASPAAAAPTSAANCAAFQTMEQLQKAGVKRCLQMAQAVGQATMSGTSQYAAASTWNNKQPDNRFSVSMIGQQFGPGQNTMPNGVSGVFSTPTTEGKCDAAAMQIIPTLDTCAAVQAQVLSKGKTLGNLAGVELLQNAANAQVMLLPAANNSCVIVALSTVYTE
jgi:hypothetical protein